MNSVSTGITLMRNERNILNIFYTRLNNLQMNKLSVSCRGEILRFEVRILVSRNKAVNIKHLF